MKSLFEDRPHFLPPEAFAGLIDEEGPDDVDLASASAWDIATRYHELKSHRGLKNRQTALRKISAAAVIEQAQRILGSLVRSSELRVAPWDDLPPAAQGAELDLDTSIEMDYPWFEYQEPKTQPVLMAVDTSLSMTGEKLALTAVAIAVVLLQFPDDPIGVVAFENDAVILKRPDEQISIQQLVERFLDVPAQGYTHLENGLKLALKQERAVGVRAAQRRASTILLSDGKYTAGRDPAYLAPKFRQLSVVKMGAERASLSLCRELAHRGHGTLRQVALLDELPLAMYSLVKDLLRGHATR